RWRLEVFVKIKAADAHTEATEFDVNVGTAGQCLDRGSPGRKDLVALAGIAANSQRPADVVQDDPARGKSPGELGEFGELRVIEPGIIAEAEAVEHGKALAKGAFADEARRGTVGGVAHLRICVPGAAMANAAKASAAGAQMCLEHRLDPAAEAQVGVADDAGAGPRLAVGAAGAHRRDAIGEFGLAHLPQLDGPAGAQHGTGLDADGGNDVVTAGGVGDELLQQVAPIGSIPEMMMWVDDRQLGLENGLPATIEPSLAHRQIEVAWRGCGWGRGRHLRDTPRHCAEDGG